MARPADPNARFALLAAARAELARHGVKGARIEDITAACGLSKGAFYLHFPSKEAVLRELVLDFIETMQAENTARLEATRAFFAQHGPLSGSDVARRSKKYEALLALEVDADLHALELMWEHRDVFSILLRGSQGTEFAETIWDLLDLQVQRIVDGFRTMQSLSVMRSDVPVEVLSSLIVGAYFLIGTQMMRASEKPDLATMAHSLHKLIREGTLPHTEVPRASRAARKKAQPRGRAVQNRSRR